MKTSARNVKGKGRNKSQNSSKNDMRGQKSDGKKQSAKKNFVVKDDDSSSMHSIEDMIV